MNCSKQIKTTKKEALAFVRYMENCGYVAHHVDGQDCIDIHFSKDDEVTADYAVAIIKGYGSFIMVRV